MAAFDRLTEGQILHDYHRERMGNTTMSREGHWTVRVISINKDQRSAYCSWNGNPPWLYTERMISRLRISEKAKKATP